jgi:DNA-3-methyladenine glycosylase I
VVRCWWCGNDPLLVPYHDQEWGRPVGDDRRLFEKLCLEGFQAGLSWLTILRKREAFRAGFAGFDPDVVAGFGPDDVERLMADAGIVRNRAKIESTIGNARRVAAAREAHGSLAAYLWAFAPGEPAPAPAWGDLAATTPESVSLSRELKRNGWTFVGPTTVYAFMQAVGMVNDHVDGCAFRPEVEEERRRFRRPGQRP